MTWLSKAVEEVIRRGSDLIALSLAWLTSRRQNSIGVIEGGLLFPVAFFVHKHLAGKLSYDGFINLLLDAMVESDYKPPAMTNVLSQIVPNPLDLEGTTSAAVSDTRPGRPGDWLHGVAASPNL